MDAEAHLANASSTSHVRKATSARYDDPNLEGRLQQFYRQRLSLFSEYPIIHVTLLIISCLAPSDA